MGTSRSSAPNGCASKIALTGRSLMREHARHRIETALPAELHLD